MKHILLILQCAVLGSVLSGCNLYSTYSRPESLPVDSLYNSETLLRSDSLESLGSLPWKSMFTDPYLQSLIERGLANNSDLRVALLRIDEAAANVKSSKLAYFPSVSLAPSGSIVSIDGGKAVKSYEIPVSVSWEVDLFGKLRNAKRESQALLLKQNAYAGAVRSELIASIANSYYTLLALDSQIAIGDSTLDLWSEQLRVLELQKKVGDVRENAVSQARANYKQLEASRNDLLRARNETENTLCTLLGETSSTIARGRLDAQSVPESLEVGVPLNLLSHRPDVVSAEMALAAAFYATNQARAAFYPSLTLGGSAGWTNSLGQAVSNPGGWILSAVGSILQPIFQRGKLTANLRISKDEQEIALINYRQAILQAGQEVNDAVYAIQSYGANIGFHSEQTEALEQTVKSNELLFRTNNATYLELLSSRQDLLNSKLNLVTDRVSRLQAAVTLYRALGGGVD